MKNAKKLLSYTYFGFFTALLMSAPAFAYLDPGTVTYVVSMIAGLFIQAAQHWRFSAGRSSCFSRISARRRTPLPLT